MAAAPLFRLVACVNDLRGLVSTLETLAIVPGDDTESGSEGTTEMSHVGETPAVGDFAHRAMRLSWIIQYFPATLEAPSQHQAFTTSMQRKDLEGMLSHMAADVVLKTPLAPHPLHGKAALRPVVSALLRVVDEFVFREFLQGPQHVSAFFGLTVGDIELDGVDYWRLNDAGFI